MTIVKTVRNAMQSFREKSYVTVYTSDGGQASGRLSYDSSEDITSVITRAIVHENIERLKVIQKERDTAIAERKWLERQVNILQAERDGLKRQIENV